MLISYGLREARTIGGEAGDVRAELLKTSKNSPAIIGWYWGLWGDTSNGGHWTVCAGPTLAGDRLVILDPWNGLQYIRVDSFWEYRVNGEVGWFDFYDNLALVTHPK